MKTITNDYKTNIKEIGRELDTKITYTDNGSTVELGVEDLNSASLHYEGSILKSVMKQLDLDSNTDIPVGTQITAQFGVKVNGTYEYITLGNFVVYSSEKQADLKSYKIICYDKLLYAMKDYEDMEITYPITIRDYINTICTHLGLTFANSSSTFPNYDKEIQNELYLDEDGNSLNYTFRDVLDELSQVTASNICINNNDELEVRYINNTPTVNQYINGENLHYNTVSKPNGASDLESYDGYNNVIYINQAVGYCTIKNQLYSQYYFDNIGAGDDVTVLVLAKKPNPNTSLSLYFSGHTTRAYVNLEKYKDLENGWAYYYATYTFKNDATNFQSTFHFQTGGEVYLAKIQVSLGDSVYDFEPYGNSIIDEEYFKDINVNFGKVFGPVNTITFKRSADSDIVSLSNPVNLPDEDKIEISISDNQILNGSDRGDYLSDILTQLYGLTYSINDFSSTGITYYELCDKYIASIDGNNYTCIMFNDEINITQGLEEHVHTDMPKETNKDYNTSSQDDRTKLRTELIVNKQEGRITGLVLSQDDLANRLDSAELELTTQGARLDVATTNIDPTTGDILELKRTGYQLGADGLVIDDEQGYKSVSNTTGTYYYDNDTMIGKYTKDGSVQKDFALFGKYYYGIDEGLDVENFTKDDAMFVGQLYEDNNDEVGFGHFWNGN